jgi:hypothetical protein
MRAQKRLARLEALHGPGPLPVAMLIHRQSGESQEQAAERFYTEYPERRGDNRTPRVYLSLSRDPAEVNAMGADHGN